MDARVENIVNILPTIANINYGIYVLKNLFYSYAKITCGNLKWIEYNSWNDDTIHRKWHQNYQIIV